MEQDSCFVKIIVVGDSGVGKTSILNKYCYDRFDNFVQPTIGCDFSTKIIPDQKNNRTLKLQLWDVAGQERYKAVSKIYIRGALGCVIISDILNEKSQESALKWKELIDENCDYVDGSPIPCYLVQNKTDMLEKVGYLEEFQKLDVASKFAKDNKFFDLIQTSAKKNENLDILFQKLVQEIIDRNMIKTNALFNNDLQQNQGKQNVKLSNATSYQVKEKKGCC